VGYPGGSTWLKIVRAEEGAVRRIVVLVAVLLCVACALPRFGRSEPKSVASPVPASNAPNGGTVSCRWETAEGSPPAVNVGTPPTTVPQQGQLTLTLRTNRGTIVIQVDRSKTPCTAASLEHLAGKHFYDNTSCHRLVREIAALQCGDPTGTGEGSSSYTVPDENLPKDKLPAYHEGDVAMANTGVPNSGGSQFFFVYGPEGGQLDGDYALFGRVMQGLDIVKQVAAGGDDGAFETQAGGGHPKLALTITAATTS
jgi:peptidyl-prolyl cis-trans isomerase B (cyclophilin B)